MARPKSAEPSIAVTVMLPLALVASMKAEALANDRNFSAQLRRELRRPCCGKGARADTDSRAS